MKKIAKNQLSTPISATSQTVPDDLLTNIAHQIAVLVVKQHRYLLEEEMRQQQEKTGSKCVILK